MTDHPEPDFETVVFLTADTRAAATVKVAGLPLLKRTWRILHRSGIRKVILVDPENTPDFARWALQSQIELHTARKWQPRPGRSLLISGDLALQHDYLRRFAKVLEKQRTNSSGSRVWVAAECGTPPGLMMIEGNLRGEFADLESAYRQLSLPGGPVPHQQVKVDAVCLRISGRDSARLFHRKIEETMIKPTDGLFARWNRKISLPLSRLLVHTPITPNGVTYLTLLVAAIAGFFLSRGGYLSMLLGAILVQVASILDGNDGELARLKIEDSDYGTWLDTICDYIAYFFTFGGIGYGLYRSSGQHLYLFMTALMFAGFLAAMALTSRLRSRYTGAAGAGALTSVVIESLERSKKEDLWAFLSHRLRHFGTRATFSYCVLLLGILDGWRVIFWVTVVAAQLYWIAVLYSEQFVKQRNP